MKARPSLVCQNPACGRTVTALTRGLCQADYQRAWRAGFPESGVPPRQCKPNGTLARCQNPACDRLVRQTTRGYCHACFQRWCRQGRPEGGPRYILAAWANKALPDEAPSPPRLRTVAAPVVARRQCENCRRQTAYGRLCSACRRHHATHGTPRPTARYALHMDAPDCHCRSCAGRRAGAARTGPRKPVELPNGWSPEQEARLRDLAGTLTVTEIAAALEAEFGLPRTVNAIKVRCVRLGLSMQIGDLSACGVASVLGLGDQRVRIWLNDGLLEGRRLTPGMVSSEWAVTPSAVEVFIRTHPECYDWRRVKAGRWRSLAEGEWRRDPLYTLTEAARWLGIVHTTIRKYIRRGYLVAGERPDRTRWERWYVRRSALVRFQQQRQHAQERAS